MPPGSPAPAGRLPDFLIIGAMKCGTTALHAYLASHPDVGVPSPKEVNFFFGDEPGGTGQWWRGVDWYADQFPRDAQVVGEASPGYTSPSHPEVADHMAEVVPGARLLYLVRDPLERALSQYAHHVRDGTERRPAAEALLDPASQYIARSRYAERVAPFLRRYPPEQLLVLRQEDLARDTAAVVRRALTFIGVDPVVPDGALERRHNVRAAALPELDPGVASAFRLAVASDQERLSLLLQGPHGTADPASQEVLEATRRG